MAKSSSSMAGPSDSLNFFPKAGELAEDFRIIKFLRHGRFTDIIKVKAKVESDNSIMKQYKFDRNNKEGARLYCNMELHCLQQVEHPLISRLICVRDMGESKGLVFRYHVRGDFLTILNILQFNRFSLEAVRFYGGQLLVALHYLHQNGISHRGVHPRHIFLKANGNLVLGDFGQARILGDDGPKSAVYVGFYHYIPPELLQALIPIYEPEEDETSKTVKHEDKRRFGRSMARLLMSCVRTMNTSRRRQNSPTTASTESPSKRSGVSSDDTNTDPTESCVAAATNVSDNSQSDDLSLFIASAEEEHEAAMSYMLDYYAVGCTMFHLLTSQVPFNDLSPISCTIYEHLTDETKLKAELRRRIENAEVVDFLFNMWKPTIIERFGYLKNLSPIIRHPFMRPLNMEDSDICTKTPPFYISPDGSYQAKMYEGQQCEDCVSETRQSSSDIGFVLINAEQKEFDPPAESELNTGKIFVKSINNNSNPTQNILTTYLLDVLPEQARSKRLQFRFREQCEQYQSDLHVELAPNKLILDRQIVQEAGTSIEKELLLMEGGTIILRDPDGENEIFLIDENDDLRECWVEGGVISKIILHAVKGDFTFYGAKGMDLRIKNMFRIYGGVNAQLWPHYARQ